MQALNILQNAYFILFLFLLTLAAVSYAAFLHFRLRKFMQGKEAKSLEDTITSIIKDNEIIKAENDELKKLALQIIQDDKRNLKAFATVKFNPFSQSGHGKQSFATAVLSANGEGFILSTLSVRGETHVFLKEVENFKAGALTEEEAQALQNAIEKLRKSESK